VKDFLTILELPFVQEWNASEVKPGELAPGGISLDGEAPGG
jgi:hypothetical protein